MGWLQLTGSKIDTPLMELLNADEIQPGQDASYQLCKLIYEYHPLGAKMTETPIKMAMSQGRDLRIDSGPEDLIKERFVDQWRADRCTHTIFNTATLARTYGMASAVAITVGKNDTETPLDLSKLFDVRLAFNVLDPLNTSGSLRLNQNPNDPDFMKQSGVMVQGVPYHPSRTFTLFCGNPIYLGYTVSAFGYVGRSVFQRALFPLKSFIQTMRTDDLVTRKVGVLIAKMKQAGSVVNGIMQKIMGQKRQLLKEAETDSVLSIDKDENIESLNLQNLDAPYNMARKNILENVALCADMPAKIINMETFAEGFGEGTEDAKNIARYIDDIREEIEPMYHWLEEITMYRAWTPEFYKSIQAEHPDTYGSVDFQTAFYEWKNSFHASFPSFLTEPPSEKSKVDKVKLDSVIQLLTTLLDKLGPEPQADLIDWAFDQFNEMKELFSSPINIDKGQILDNLLEMKNQADEMQKQQLEAGASDDDEGDEAPKPQLKAVK